MSPVGMSEDLTGSSHLPSEHTQHLHLISPVHPAGSWDERYLPIDFPLISHGRRLTLPLVLHASCIWVCPAACGPLGVPHLLQTTPRDAALD